uniref:Mitochondrial carrier protein n=1 Tax=Clastoptera arizonana TaxID=38151 RepID=A0A1B6EEB9_9HEMI
MSEEKKDVPTYVKFAIAGIGGMGSTLVVQPIDVIKNRMQLSGEGGVKREHTNSYRALGNIIQKEGFAALYHGLSANLFRQATYTTARMGFYQSSNELLQKSDRKGFTVNVMSAMVSGFLAALLTNPSDVALVRMTTDGRLPVSQRRNYSHVFNALYRIGREEGVRGLWIGALPTICRAVAANTSQLVSYTQFKNYVIEKGYFKDNTACHLFSSCFSGFVYATLTSPFDTGKTRIQTMKTETGTPLYTGLLDVWSKTVRAEGFFALWKGYVPYLLRVTPATILLFIFCEQQTMLYKKYVMGVSDPKGL